MRTKINYHILNFSIALFVVVISIFGINHIQNKVNLPFKLTSIGANLIVTESNLVNSRISIGDTIVAIDNISFTEEEEIEIYLDGLNQNSKVKVTYLKNGLSSSDDIYLIHYYSNFYILTAGITGLLLILIGTFVFWKKPESKPARLFNWVTLSTACIVLMTWGKYSIPPTPIDYILHILFSLCYSLAPVLFIHFTLNFPRVKTVPSFIIKLLYLSAIVLSLFSTIYFSRAISLRTINSIQQFLILFNISRVYIFSCIISGFAITIHTYLTSKNILEKKKLRWILVGFALGPLLFACLWVIPLAILNYGIVTEEVVVSFMLFVPVTFAIAILKHHIFNIDVIIKRSVIYFFSFGILILFYVLIISIISQFVKDLNEYLTSGVAAIIIALLFHPAKERIQKFIDKKLFRINYDFRVASRKCLDEIKNCSDVKTLTEKIIYQINLLIPVTKQGFFLLSKSNSRVYLEADYNFEILAGRSIFLDQKKLKTNLSQPIALNDRVEPGSRIEEADAKVFKRWGISLVFPIKSSTEQLLGFLVLGEKKSEKRFTIEDIDLLIEVSLEAGLTIERIQIQEELIREKLLKEKFRDLNELKSFFISSVSHELKTPLTSIKMFSEFLHLNENIKEKEKEEYLEIIQGECDRLSRFIENVLDLSKIERGVMEFHHKNIDLKSLLENSVALISYQIKMEKCEVILNICEDECILNGDPDLIQSAVLNLLSNGIKYSSHPKKVLVNILKEKNSISINFENNGNFILPEELLKISEPYYRSEAVKKENIPGSGIGLTLVNQIMEAHNGKLLINNTPDNGCRFTLFFLMENSYEKNINS